MSEKIKTRTVHKDIKIVDKTIHSVGKLRQETEQMRGRGNGQTEEDASNYATGRLTATARSGVEMSAGQMLKRGKQIAGKIKSKEREKSTSFSEHGENVFYSKEAKEKTEIVEKQSVIHDTKRKAGKKKAENSQTKTGGMDKIKTKMVSCRNGTENCGGMIKGKQKTIKTSSYTQKTTIKTTDQIASASKRGAKKAAQDAKKAVQASRQAKKEAKRTLRAAAKVFQNTIRSILLATKSLGTLIIAGGSTVVIIIILIMMLGAVVSSPMGIFFSGDSGDSTTKNQSMPEIVTEINGEYQAKIQEIKKANTYDKLEMSGAKASWREVLSIYAVKTNTDPENPREVATIDDEKKELLCTIFWEMNVITHRTEKKKEVVKEESDDGKGNVKQKEKEVTRTYLYIKVTHKSASEMAKKYRFNKSQNESLTEILAEKNMNLWASVLHGITGTPNSVGDGDIVAMAKSQIGNIGGEPYWRWYGFNSRVSWCACFVSWCANQCGYIESGVIPKFSLCTDGVSWFKKHGRWQGRDYTPAPGDIIFFDWDSDGSADHVGIVEISKKGTVYTIEGNTSDSCKQHSYLVGSGKILGYGLPEY